jgi:hypothetical protein
VSVVVWWAQFGHSMDHIEIANLAGVTLADLGWLLRGEASANVANRLGVTMADVESFIRGEASAAMTERLGLRTLAAAQELAQAAGRQGAIGIVIGLLISS